MWKHAQGRVRTADFIQVPWLSRGGQPAWPLCQPSKWGPSGPNTYFHYQTHIPGIPG